MSTSNVAIANRAIQKLGAERIESLSEDSPNARSLNACFEQIRRAELRRYDWGFAIKRASIAADSDQTEWGDWNRYSLPNDYLRLIREDETGFATDWRIEGLFIVTASSAPLDIRYIADIDDPNYFDSLFIDSFAAKLAYETCQDITGSTGKQQQMAQDYKDAVAEAKRTGAIEKPAQDFPEDQWLTVRF